MIEDLPAQAGSAQQDKRFVLSALDEAHRALETGDVPVGAVVVHGERVIGRGHNQRELLHDPTAHAEMLALTAAAQFLKSWRLVDCTVYVTLEPCVMCAGAIILGRVSRLVFGAVDPKAGACGSVFDITSDPRLNHQVSVQGGVLQHECGAILQSFFKQQRALGKK